MLDRIALVCLLAVGALGLPQDASAQGATAGEVVARPGSADPVWEPGQARFVPVVDVVTLNLPGTGHGAVEITPEIYSRGFFGRIADTIGYYITYAWDTLAGGMAPPTPASYAAEFSKKDPDSFWTLLSDAGYKLKEIDSDVGLIPDVSFKFKHVRELSDADITWLERKLERHSRMHTDWLSRVQRSIVYTLLEINDGNEYFVDTLVVDLLPLPKAKFTLEPWEGGLPEEFDILLRAIQGREINPRRARRLE